MVDSRTIQTIEFLGFSRVAKIASGLSDASASNGWASTRYVWQVVSYSAQEAYDYWMGVYDSEEDHEQAYGELIEALNSCGKTVRDICQIMS